MTTLLEIRDTIKKIYSKNAVFIIPVLKFVLALVVFLTINGKMGYMTKLDNMAIVLVASLMCSFLPSAIMVMLAGMFSLAHMYALSLETALVGLCIYMVLMLLFLRFDSKDILAVVLTPLLFFMKIPYVIPIAMGLVGTPFSAVSVGCGVIVYYLLTTIIGSASTISTMGEDPTGKIRLLIDGLLQNKAMLVVVVAFGITVVVVYVIRRMAVEHCWTIAMVAGVMVNLIILLVGDLLYDTNTSILMAVVGCILALMVGKIIEFFRFCVDFGRAEKVQFEDDEYYYYVKAVPKMTVAETTKTVKRINSQKRPSPRPERAQSAERNMPRGERAGNTQRPASRGERMVSSERPAPTRQRTVTTERTTGGRDLATQRRQSSYTGRRNETVGSSRSVTINSDNTFRDMDIEEIDDFEELF